MKSPNEKIDKIIKLSQNENPFGASPLALKAIEKNYHSVNRYPEIIHEDLRNKLAKKYNVIPGNIVVSAGSVEVMDMAIKAFVGFDENIVTSEKTFVAYKLLARIHRRECKLAKLVNNTVNVENIISMCDEKTRLIFIANPNNPTGTIITHDSLHTLLKAIPSQVFVVIDEAYIEYVNDTSYPHSLELQKSFPNLIILRTFSKIYGLAGLRIGYGITHTDVRSSLIKHKTPFSVSHLSNVAAIASLDDEEFVKKSISVNEKERAFLQDAFKNMGLNITPSLGSFVCLEFDSLFEKEEVHKYLRNEGIIIRDLGPFGIEKGLRTSVGRPDENVKLVDCLSDCVKSVFMK
jgi:histidinol-phosphate aminotransferase